MQAAISDPTGPPAAARAARKLDRVRKPRRSVPASEVSNPTASRVEAAADAIGSVRAEGLDPGRAGPLLSAWARGELGDAQLEQARLALLGDRAITVEELLRGARAA